MQLRPPCPCTMSLRLGWGPGPPRPYASLPPAKRTRGNRSVLGGLLLPDPSGLGAGPLTGTPGTRLWVTFGHVPTTISPEAPPPGPGAPASPAPLSSATAWTTQLSPSLGPRILIRHPLPSALAGSHILEPDSPTVAGAQAFSAPTRPGQQQRLHSAPEHPNSFLNTGRRGRRLHKPGSCSLSSLGPDSDHAQPPALRRASIPRGPGLPRGPTLS